MKEKIIDQSIIKKKYLKFIKSQEVPGEPFLNKVQQLEKFYLPISKFLHKNFIKNKGTIIIGLSGGQGSGKSTISKIMKIILKEKYNLNTVIFSIDDFYKTLDEREKMSKKISQLFLTRGVPGTHDTKILLNVLKKLKSVKFRKISVPKFDKSNDNRCKKKDWLKIKSKPDIVIFEGWCVGAEAQKKTSLIKPLNDLEMHEDQKLIWRKKVNSELKNNYKKVFNLIDILIFLKIPSFKYVYKWRALQEKKLNRFSKGKKIMNKLQVRKFIMFYERITRHMIKTLNSKADLTISMDTKHYLKSMKFN